MVPGQVPPVQVNDVAAGVQLAIRVAVAPARTEVGDALRVQVGVAAPVWHACQLTPVAVSQAVSIAAMPLEARVLAHSVLPPAAKEAGGAGTGPVKRLLLTLKFCNDANPLNDGIGPVSWLLFT